MVTTTLTLAPGLRLPLVGDKLTQFADLLTVQSTAAAPELVTV
jgi:hypothetical protein